MHASRLARGAGTIAAAGLFAGLLGGLALGNFATVWSGAESDSPMFASMVGNPNAAFPVGTSAPNNDDLNGPPMSQVVCKGCGPGISERMTTSYAFGYDDRAVQAYMEYHPDPPLTGAALEAEVAPKPAPKLAVDPTVAAAPAGPQAILPALTPPAEAPIPTG